MGVHVALLRGINVGGKNRLPMARLVAMFEKAGCTEVETYIQSGNVVFSASAATAKKIPEAIAKTIHGAFALSVPVVTRTAAELGDVVATNPFLATGADPKTLHVAFLADRPTPAQVAALDPNRSPPDALVVLGRDVLLHLPNGVGRSKITNAWLDAKLGTTSTIRNWRTVLELAALAGSLR